MSKLINGFKTYESISEFFNNVAEEMIKNGECNLNGNVLLDRFCKVDGIKDALTIKSIFDEKKNPLNFVKSYNELKELIVKNNYNYSLLDKFFENESDEKFSILVEPNFDEDHECFCIPSPIGHIIFGEFKKAPYFSKHINKKEKLYFVTIDKIAMVGEDCELIQEKTFVTDIFELAAKYTKMLVNTHLNEK